MFVHTHALKKQKLGTIDESQYDVPLFFWIIAPRRYLCQPQYMLVNSFCHIKHLIHDNTIFKPLKVRKIIGRKRCSVYIGSVKPSINTRTS